MKIAIALALLLIFGAAAQAKLAPVEPEPAAISIGDLAIATGPAAATLEQDYFRAPQPANASSQVFPCRLRLMIFDKTRIAQSCR